MPDKQRRPRENRILRNRRDANGGTTTLFALAKVPPALAILAAVAMIFLADAPYLLVQGAFAIKDVFGARPFDEVSDPSEAEELLFSRSRDIRRFGIERLGLSNTKSYTRYKRIDREALVWVVSGVRETAWERHLWGYPLVGSLPYRGYYRREDALEEADRLKARGFDTVVRRVTAYSFLGVVPDPLYSFSLERPHSSLADLILHEMAHATLFVSGQGSFNENFATFVGLEGSRNYIEELYGADSEEYAEMVGRRRDREVARRLMRQLYEQLEKHFDSAEGDKLLSGKERIYTEFQARLAEDYSQLFSTDAYRWLAESELNNAVVDLFIKYSGELDLFYGLLAQQGDSLSRVIKTLQAHRKALRRDGLEEVRRLMEVSTPDQG